MNNILAFRQRLTLRWYQEEPLNEFFGCDESLFVHMATGSGKGEMTVGFVVWALKENKRVLIVVRRISLVRSISDRLKKYGIKSGVIQGSHREGLDQRAGLIQEKSY